MDIRDIGASDAALADQVSAGGWDSLNQFGFYGGLMVRIHRMPHAGDMHDGHEHHIDHVTLVAQGAIRVKWRRYKDGEVVAFGEKDFTAPTFATIRADTHHQITALADDTVWMCLFAVPPEYAGSAVELTNERNTLSG